MLCEIEKIIGLPLTPVKYPRTKYYSRLGLHYFEWYEGKINIYEFCVKSISTRHQNYISGILIALNMCYFNHHNDVWSSVVPCVQDGQNTAFFEAFFKSMRVSYLERSNNISFYNYDKWYLQRKGSNIN